MTFVSLQYGEADRDTVALRRDFGILIADASEIDEFNDLDGLATLIAACDAIVSIDNTTVHLGVALGQQPKFSCPWKVTGAGGKCGQTAIGILR